MNGIDLNRFEFDYDTTWNAFFLDADLNVYSRYGGRGAGEPDERLSRESLLQTMQEVLAVHAQRQDTPRQGDNVSQPPGETSELAELPALQPVDSPPFRPEDLSLLKKNHRGCLHCHQVREYQLLQWAHDGQFSRRKLFGWPLPENLGLILRRDHGHRVQDVVPESAAAAAGFQAGDVIDVVDRVPVHSEYDVRWALHRAADEESLPVRVSRRTDEGQAVARSLLLALPSGWRHTDLGWRKSLRSVPFAFGIRAYSLTRSQRESLSLDDDQLAVRVIAARADGLAGALGLQKGDIIVQLGTQRADRTYAQFQSDVLATFAPGQTVRLTVLRDGQPRELSGVCPDWQTDETTVP